MSLVHRSEDNSEILEGTAKQVQVVIEAADPFCGGIQAGLLVAMNALGVDEVKVDLTKRDEKVDLRKVKTVVEFDDDGNPTALKSTFTE